ncbi:hypothetical protein C0J52_17056 [Blattella germanica]|nr:hypothetical protein C0J52_17056 [Blattella germanica]
MQQAMTISLLIDDSEGDISLKVISPSLENSLQMSEMQINQQRKRKSFRLEWLDVPEFKDWLSPDPDSPFKARCLACSTILNAGKSELEKHAADDVDDMYDTTVNNSTQTELSGEEISAGLKEEQNKHLELLTRIATSMECMAAATTSALESLSKNQETLTNILIHLTNK